LNADATSEHYRYTRVQFGKGDYSMLRRSFLSREPAKTTVYIVLITSVYIYNATRLIVQLQLFLLLIP